LSFESYLFEDFTYYPNPIKDQLILKAGTQIESVSVYNFSGQIVLTWPSKLIGNVDEFQKSFGWGWLDESWFRRLSKNLSNN